MLNVNTEAPDFTLCDENGVKHSLSEYRRKRVILYFYPKDNTNKIKVYVYLILKTKRALEHSS